MELQNRHRLNLRKQEELEEKVGYFNEENENLEEENRQLKLKEHEQTVEYREKLERFTKNTSKIMFMKIMKPLSKN